MWLGVSSGADELAALADVIDRDHRAARIRRPTTTVRSARTSRWPGSARPRRARVLVEHLGTGPAGPPLTVDRVVLFDSDTRSEGAVHTPRADFGLGTRS